MKSSPPGVDPEREPLFVIEDAPRPVPLAVLTVVALGWLAWRLYSRSPGERWLLPDFLAGGLALAGIFLVTGARRIEIDDSEIHVYRRGRLRLRRSLEELSGFGGDIFFFFTTLRFRDGSWVLWFPFGEWTAPTDYLTARFAGTPPLPTPSGIVELDAARISFPSRCVRCGKKTKNTWAVTARRGFNLLLTGWAVVRGLPVPACSPCSRRRRVIGWLLFLAAFGGFAVALFLPPSDLRKLLLVVGVAGLLFVVNRGAEVADHIGLGVRARLLKGGGRIALRFRDPALAATVAQRAEAGPGRKAKPDDVS